MFQIYEYSILFIDIKNKDIRIKYCCNIFIIITNVSSNLLFKCKKQKHNKKLKRDAVYIMIVLSIIIVAISLHLVNNPLVSPASRDPISPIFITRILSTLFLGFSIIGFHALFYTDIDNMSTISLVELSKVTLPLDLQFSSKLFEAVFI